MTTAGRTEARTSKYLKLVAADRACPAQQNTQPPITTWLGRFWEDELAENCW